MEVPADGSRAPKLGINQEEKGFDSFGRKHWGPFAGFIMVIKCWELRDRDRIGPNCSGITPQLCFALALLRGTSCGCGGLGAMWPRAGGLGDKVFMKSWTFLHRPPLQPHVFLGAERSGRAKTGIN